jgi:hypothetical protein
MVKIAKIFVIAFVLLVLGKALFINNVEFGNIGVRVSNVGGVHEEDLGAGWRSEVVGVQKIWQLPGYYQFLNFTGPEALEIRTKDNNIVKLDISVPYRIQPGSAHQVVMAGNHVGDGNGGYRYQRLMRETTIGILRANLADLQSSDFYDTERRVAVAVETSKVLNEELAPLHLETKEVLMRASYFRVEYEQQLAQIQLNEQSKLLDGARTDVADRQQKLDNYTQTTNAQAAASEQAWVKRIANMDRAYQVGFVNTDDQRPGGARRALGELSEEERAEITTKAAGVFDLQSDEIDDEYLLGIQNIHAETLEYNNRVRAEANGVSARLAAEGDAMVAEVNGNYETRINSLLDTSAGRAYVAYEAAGNIKFAEHLTFQSRDGIPSVLRLRDFARSFMGK